MVVQKLIEEITEIQNVGVWECKTKVSGSWLYNSMKKTFNKTPGQILREIRFELIVRLIESKIDISSRDVCLKAGLRNKNKYNHSDSLYKFLSRHYDTNFTDLKVAILKEELLIQHKWLNGEWKKAIR